MCRGLENILDLTIRKVFCKRVPKARDNYLDMGEQEFFFSIVNVTVVCKKVLFKKVLMQLPTSLMRNAFFFKMSFK